MVGKTHILTEVRRRGRSISKLSSNAPVLARSERNPGKKTRERQAPPDATARALHRLDQDRRELGPCGWTNASTAARSLYCPRRYSNGALSGTAVTAEVKTRRHGSRHERPGPSAGR